MIKRILSILDKTEEAVITVLFAIVLLIVGYVVVGRFVFSYTPSWAEQVARIIFVWISFAGVSLAAKKSMHLRVSAINQVLSRKAGNYMLLFGELVTMVVAFVVAYRILLFTLTVAERGQKFAAMPNVPVWIMYVAGALGMFGMGIRIFQVTLWPRITKRINKGNDGDAELEKNTVVGE